MKRGRNAADGRSMPNLTRHAAFAGMHCPLAKPSTRRRKRPPRSVPPDSRSGPGYLRHFQLQVDRPGNTSAGQIILPDDSNFLFASTQAGIPAGMRSGTRWSMPG